MCMRAVNKMSPAKESSPSSARGWVVFRSRDKCSLSSMSSLPSSPSSSPPSSPALDGVDSSPPGTPDFDPVFSSPSGPSHPFAASTKATKPLPLYEKHGTKRPRQSERWGSQIEPDLALEELDLDGVASNADNRPVGEQARMSARVVDPFSGSAKHDWIPPNREKRAKIHSRTPSASSTMPAFLPIPPPSQLPGASKRWQPQPFVRGRTNSDPDLNFDEPLRERVPLYSRPRQVSMNSEQQRWEEAIGSAVTQANGYVDLSASGVMGTVLTHIPPCVGDLASLTLLQSSRERATQALRRRSASPDPHVDSDCIPKRVFARSATVPTRQPGVSIFDHNSHNISAKAKSSMHVTMRPLEEDTRKTTDIQLILQKNAISFLPRELWLVVNLTVLDLAYNVLERLPPQIVQLVKLRELNVRNNRLRYLPAEILDMKLEVLDLGNNPWVERQDVDLASREGGGGSSKASLLNAPWGSQHDERTSRVVTDTVTLFNVTSLGEYSLRTLLAPYCPDPPPDSVTLLPNESTAQSVPTSSPKQSPPWPHYKSNLQAHYLLPLPADLKCPPYFLDALRECLPDAVARPDGKSHVQGHSVTPGSSSHSRTTSLQEELFASPPKDAEAAQASSSSPFSSQGSTLTAVSQNVVEDKIQNSLGLCLSPNHVPLSSRVFTKHAEERYTWEAVVAGVPLGSNGPVPVLWRGCSRGCLRFLNPPKLDTNEALADDDLEGEPDEDDSMEMELDLARAEAQSDDGFGVVAMDFSGDLSFD